MAELNPAPPASPDAAKEAATTHRPLYLQQRFAPMWTGFSLGVFADNMLRQALIIGISFGAIATPGLAGDAAVPIIGSVFAVAMFLFSPIAGQAADKFETLSLFKRTKFIELLIMALAAVGFYLSNGLVLIAALLAMGAQSAFFSPVRIGAMPKYFLVSELVRANAYFNLGLFVSILAGLIVGGLLITQAGGPLLVAGVLLAAALMGWIAIQRAPTAHANDPGLKMDWNIPAQTIRIIGFALRAPGVAWPMVGYGCFFFISTLVTVLTPLYARDALGAGEGVATLIMVAFALGAGLGAIAASMLARGRTGLGVSTGGIALAGLMSLGAWALTNEVGATEGQTVGALLSRPAGILLCLAFGLSSAFMGLFIAPLQAAMQRRAPLEKRARIMAASNMVNAAAAFLGSNAVLVVTQTSASKQTALIFVGLMQLAIASYMLMRYATTKPGLYDEALSA